MAAGTHWEWRAFGVPPLQLVLRSRRWNRLGLFEELGNGQLDEYLWFPGIAANVKIRDGSLKWKRLLKAEEGCELWTEREGEVFDFPLSEEATDFVVNRLSCLPPGHVSEWGIDFEMLKSKLFQFDPPLQLIPVRKHRIQFTVEHSGYDFLVEFVEILEPRPAFSILVEAEDLGGEDRILEDTKAVESLGRLRGVVERLGLPGGMEVTGYLQMLERWMSAE